MYLLGIDLGTSFVKASIVDAATKRSVCSVSYPESEVPIIVRGPDWAEQDPDTWWHNVQSAILKLKEKAGADYMRIGAIGIAYQMHGLVCVDKDQRVLRDSIIWCDSRAVSIGNKAFDELGREKCLTHLLNSPGNFTASKLKWVKDNEPAVFDKIDKIMLPGDFIAMKLTGQLTTSISALSEGIFWDFKTNSLSEDVFHYYGFETHIIPTIQNVFSDHGKLLDTIAGQLGLPKGIAVCYKAGDQPNNALSLNVFQPGEAAATAGTSGVVYAVTDQLLSDVHSRINGFAHVNYTIENPRIGVLLNINGVGSANSWTRNMLANGQSYEGMNAQAAQIGAGSEGVKIYPFGNGAERIFRNKTIQAQFCDIQFNIHKQAHLFRAVQEGIAFAFRYGMDIIRENNMDLKVIKAAHANMFLSPVFVDAFVNTLNVPVELYPVDGSVGAALGAGLGMGVFTDEREAFGSIPSIQTVVPNHTRDIYGLLYQSWKDKLEKFI
ncbi:MULTISPECIES: xylulokinase [Chitinophagaceae]